MEEQNNNESSMPKMEEEGKGGGQSGKIIGLVIVLALVVLGIYVLARGKQDDNGITPEAASTANEEVTAAVEENAAVTPSAPAADTATSTAAVAPVAQTVTVVFTAAGFAPAAVSIKKGDSVMFVNQAAAMETWPASAMHPTHTAYPGSGIEKCGTDQAAGIFDACRGLKTTESFTFQFNEIGKWNYHDHLNAGKFGSVEVAE